ncbi:hypothetical protein [Microvirga antarctica]|uniref:hypothetical protein n=1 Tax=Microvirga antarctica TaxID=2819233 RepID=UPI001B3066C6|nr:hypothetical protein [Microvirga antarctica]
MRRLIAPPALVLIALSLSGCNTGAPQGVLPRTSVPPPPSLAGPDSRRNSASAEKAAATQRRPVSVPSTLSTPAPAESTIQPVMTGSGVGAGFKF